MRHSFSASQSFKCKSLKGVPVSGFISIYSFRFYCVLVSGYFMISMPVSYYIWNPWFSNWFWLDSAPGQSNHSSELISQSGSEFFYSGIKMILGIDTTLSNESKFVLTPKMQNFFDDRNITVPSNNSDAFSFVTRYLTEGEINPMVKYTVDQAQNITLVYETFCEDEASVSTLFWVLSNFSPWVTFESISQPSLSWPRELRQLSLSE